MKGLAGIGRRLPDKQSRILNVRPGPKIYQVLVTDRYEPPSERVKPKTIAHEGEGGSNVLLLLMRATCRSWKKKIGKRREEVLYRSIELDRGSSVHARSGLGWGSGRHRNRSLASANRMVAVSAFVPKNMAAEFLGTFILVFTVGCHTLNGAVNTSFTGLSVGSTLMVLVYALGPVSGAHLNPAVTFGTAIAGKKIWGEALIYMVIQLAGDLPGLS